jgi:hypothetical protein
MGAIEVNVRLANSAEGSRDDRLALSGSGMHWVGGKTEVVVGKVEKEVDERAADRKPQTVLVCIDLSLDRILHSSCTSNYCCLHGGLAKQPLCTKKQTIYLVNHISSNRPSKRKRNIFSESRQRVEEHSIY